MPNLSNDEIENRFTEQPHPDPKVAQTYEAVRPGR